SRRISSARRSAAVTKLAGPLSDVCRCSISPKSRLSVRLALRAALIITLRRAERSMVDRAAEAMDPRWVRNARSGGHGGRGWGLLADSVHVKSGTRALP